jgi:iron complex outermembrane receptor protein
MPRFSAIGGVFLLDEVDRQPTSIRELSSAVESRLDPRVEADAWALFGQVTADITNRMALTAGLRYSDEKKRLHSSGARYPFSTPDSPAPGSAYAVADAVSYAAWTPKVGLEIQVRSNGLIYASATRGFKSGGFNGTATSPGRGYAPEWAFSYEGGFKSRIAGGRARVNVAAFYNDHTDLQVQQLLVPGVLDITNAAAATIRGVETEGAVHLPGRLQVGGHLAYLDARYDRYIAPGPNNVSRDVAGNRLSNSPEWSGRLSLTWAVDSWQPGRISASGDTIWQTRVFFGPFNDAIETQSAYGIVHLRAALESTRGRWTLAFLVRNLTDQDYITGTARQPPPAIGGRPGEPRNVGVQFTIRK